MALGGGTFFTQNKTLPGTYINFVSTKKADSTLGERGVATMPLALEWGIEQTVIKITREEFEQNSFKLFGYEYKDPKLKGLRDLFKNIRVLYAYRLNKGVKANNTWADAKYSGKKGNDIKITIKKAVSLLSEADDETYSVLTYFGNVLVDEQVNIKQMSDLKANDYVTWKTEASLSEQTAQALTSGTDGDVNVSEHQGYLNKIEAYAYNVMGVVTKDNSTQELYINFAKRMRDTLGAKFQVVLYNKKADYEGVINVKNKCTDSENEEPNLVYWVTGVEAGCPINKSCLNKIYDGEYTINTEYTQLQLEDAITNGEFILHKVSNDVRVLSDINSLTTLSDIKGEIFKDNQTIRVIDQIANDIATLFTEKYLGIIPNDESGRISLWADIVQHHNKLAEIRAIENFNDKDIVIQAGENKKAIAISDKITIINSMAQLYMTVQIE